MISGIRLGAALSGTGGARSADRVFLAQSLWCRARRRELLPGSPAKNPQFGISTSCSV
jgi:hypothetical protein